MNTRFAISQTEMASLDPQDFKITRMKDWWFVRMLKHANELGLQGKRITEVFRFDEQFANRQTYIDFKVEEAAPSRK